MIHVPVFSKCFEVGIALRRAGVQTDVPCNLSGLRKSHTPPRFRKIWTFWALRNAISSFCRIVDEKNL